MIRWNCRNYLNSKSGPGGIVSLRVLPGTKANPRVASALSTPPPLSPHDQAQIDVTPRTAARLQKPAAASKAKRPRLMVADEELELPDAAFAAPDPETSNILTTERYLPSDPEMIRFTEITANPNAFFLPTLTINNVSMIYAGPEGLAPELTSLFTFPSNILRRSRNDEAAEQAAKRPRLGESPEDVEAARRDSRRLSEMPGSVDIGASGLGDVSMDLGFGDGGMDYTAGDIEPQPFSTPIRAPREASLAPSRAESIAREVQYGGESGDYPLAMFATTRRGESQTQSQVTPTKSVAGSEVTSGRGGMSKNTGMAMGLLRRELERIEAGEEDERQTLSFNEVSQGVSAVSLSSRFVSCSPLFLSTRPKSLLPRCFSCLLAASVSFPVRARSGRSPRSIHKTDTPPGKPPRRLGLLFRIARTGNKRHDQGTTTKSIWRHFHRGKTELVGRSSGVTGHDRHNLIDWRRKMEECGCFLYMRASGLLRALG